MSKKEKTDFVPITDERVLELRDGGRRIAVTITEFIPHLCHKEFEYLVDTHIQFGEISFNYEISSTKTDEIVKGQTCVQIAFTPRHVSLGGTSYGPVPYTERTWLRYKIVDFLIANKLLPDQDRRSYIV